MRRRHQDPKLAHGCHSSQEAGLWESSLVYLELEDWVGACQRSRGEAETDLKKVTLGQTQEKARQVSNSTP